MMLAVGVLEMERAAFTQFHRQCSLCGDSGLMVGEKSLESQLGEQEFCSGEKSFCAVWLVDNFDKYPVESDRSGDDEHGANFLCIVLNVLCPAIWINRFAFFGYISVSTIDLLGPGQHWDCDGAFNDMVCLLFHRIHFLSWNRETSLGCSFRWASPPLWFTMEQTKCLWY